MTATAYPGFCSIKQLGVFQLLLLDGMLSSPLQVTPTILSGFPDGLLVPIYTPGQ